MKIDGTSMSPVGSIQTTNRVASLDKKTTEQGTDGVKVSDKAQFYQLLLQKVKDVPEIREDRVQEVSQQIKNGEFTVDANAIARSLLFGKE
ncbi:flagellar biosynthesis anti-sigma factor FlgM [Desulfitobacterium metallireducens]|uniref:Negative regulator of flagellin synthesis n=1 Tax=Desulfitobacterium metallireducens DSM 15288 TaxID=871968 RepID=W0EE77_9FIRM|nr:flagellar biosynthesis anti-sigma factor FlgM [Desulfitobacterium metallireducens]AHF07813.1 flagellar biosynthesis anti-sigma factor protein FlgM [Desulfitobacterium metallireducens DSM 15288]